MREDVAGLEALDHLVEDRIGIDRQSALLGPGPELAEVDVHRQRGLAAHPGGEPHHVQAPAREAADLGVGLQAPHQVRIAACGLHGGRHVEAVRAIQLRVVVPLQAPHEVGRQEGQHARVRRLGDVAAKARQRDAARPALVDQRGHARVHAAQVGVQAESSGDAFVDVGMGVDQTRQHQLPATVDHLDVRSGGHRQVRSDRGHATRLDEHVEQAVPIAGRVDQVTALEQRCLHHGWPDRWCGNPWPNA